MEMPPHVLTLTTHLRDFLADIDKGRRPDWNTIERASFKFCTLKLHLHALTRDEIVVITNGKRDRILPVHANPVDDSVPAYTDAQDLVPPPDVRHNPNIPPPTGFNWHDDDDYPSHKPNANPPLDPGNE